MFKVPALKNTFFTFVDITVGWAYLPNKKIFARLKIQIKKEGDKNHLLF